MERIGTINREHALPVKRQAELVGISRGSVCYLPRAVPAAELALMRRMDELHLNHPYAGSRLLRDLLQREGVRVGRKHVCTLMRRMGIEALYRRPGTSKPYPGHAIYPYLLRHLTIDRANQVWALDTTYVAMARGFVYLTALIDWASRKVLAHRVAVTLEACHAVEVLTEAFNRYGVPDIINTDQGSQFTAAEFTDLVRDRGYQMSMDGRSAWRDNVFVERLWRTVKHEEIYLHAYDTVLAAKTGIARHLDWYNWARPHSSWKSLPNMLRRPRTPDEAYLMLSPGCRLAA